MDEVGGRTLTSELDRNFANSIDGLTSQFYQQIFAEKIT